MWDRTLKGSTLGVKRCRGLWAVLVLSLYFTSVGASLRGEEEEEGSSSGWSSAVSTTAADRQVSSSFAQESLLSGSDGAEQEGEGGLNRSHVERRGEKEIYILSLDGGGIKGVIPAYLTSWLEEQVESELKKQYPEAPAPEVRLGDCFQLMAGTSTGGIIVLGARIPDPDTQRPKYKASTLLRLYEKHGSVIFPVARQKKLLAGILHTRYTPQPLEQLFQEYFGAHTLKDLLGPTVITTYDLDQEDLMLFKSYAAKKCESQNFLVREVARATSAAPTYLPCITMGPVDQPDVSKRHTFCDGGVSANNPTLYAYLEAIERWPQARFYLISLGCGQENILHLEKNKNGGQLTWVKDIVPVLMSTTSAATHRYVAQLAKQRGDIYIRLQPTLDQRVSAMDNASTENINHLIGYAKREIEDPHSKVHAIKQTLIDSYRQRLYYVHYGLIDQLAQALKNDPQTINLSHQVLCERALWEVHHFIQQKGDAINNIHHLDLSHARNLSPQSLHWLEGLRELQTINLSSTGLTAAGLEELKKTLTSLTGQVTLIARENPRLLEIDGNQLEFLLRCYQGIQVDNRIYRQLGEFYEQQRDYEKAVSYYQKGSDLLNQLALMKVYLQDLAGGAGAIEKGLKLCQRLAEAGDSEAQYTFGHLLAKPESGIEEALRQLGLYEEEGLKRVQEAARWYQLAANQHHKRAARTLAGLYENGKVRIQSPPQGARDGRHHLREALRYYQIAKQAGSETVDRDIDRVTQELADTEGDS